MKILGHNAERRKAGKCHPLSTQHGRDRIIVDGFSHPSGASIRFKSVQRAENYIRNCRVVIGETEAAH